MGNNNKKRRMEKTVENKSQRATVYDPYNEANWMVSHLTDIEFFNSDMQIQTFYGIFYM